MTRGVYWTGRTRWLAIGVLAGLTIVGTVHAQGTDRSASDTRVRGGDTRARLLLKRGSRESATFRGIVAALERSDLIVHVETRHLHRPGQLQLLAVTPACRHVRVSVRTPGLEVEQIAWLAHELQHAIEIAAAPEVRDQASLAGLYERIGHVDRETNTAESSEAQETWATVLNEMYSW